ncbi:MAG: hypothetical protein DRP00_03105 [Candidatus Aenigmatarchaeota archaeon]|nr:MAG: hypothetical protein DRP00_03105 [Candidatus Aenigmarchaeota archaeon]
MANLEKEVLKELARKLVARKSEIKDFLKKKVKNGDRKLETITKSLKDKGLITYVSVIGESCIAITQRGMRELEG